MENSKLEKQIEEMAFNLIMATSPLGVKDLTKQFDYKTVATDLYELYGWRKADEVAREIFEVIHESIKAEKFHHNNFGYLVYLEDIDRILTELKKKYTEDGKENNVNANGL